MGGGGGDNMLMAIAGDHGTIVPLLLMNMGFYISNRFDKYTELAAVQNLIILNFLFKIKWIYYCINSVNSRLSNSDIDKRLVSIRMTS